MAQLQTEIAPVIAVNKDGFAKNLEPRLGPLGEDVVGRVFPVERVGTFREVDQFVLRNRLPVRRQSVFPDETKCVQDDGR